MFASLPHRGADPQGPRPQGLAALGRLAGHRPHRGDDRRRRQHRQVHRLRGQPRGDGHQEQPRGRRGDRPPAPAARHRRHHRRRLHRHGAGVQPRPRAAPPGRVPGPRPHPPPGRRGHLARPGPDDPQADRHRPARGLLRDLRPLPRAAAWSSRTPPSSRAGPTTPRAAVPARAAAAGAAATTATATAPLRRQGPSPRRATSRRWPGPRTPSGPCRRGRPGPEARRRRHALRHRVDEQVDDAAEPEPDTRAWRAPTRPRSPSAGRSPSASPSPSPSPSRARRGSAPATSKVVTRTRRRAASRPAGPPSAGGVEQVPIGTPARPDGRRDPADDGHHVEHVPIKKKGTRKR